MQQELLQNGGGFDRLIKVEPDILLTPAPPPDTAFHSLSQFARKRVASFVRTLDKLAQIDSS